MAMVLVVAATINMYGQQEGNAAPDFEVNLEGGGTFKLSDQQGKVVFVFLFGNTCPSCKAVGPDVESSIYQKYKNDSSFTAIGLDTWDGSSNETTVSGFRNSTGITFPLAIKAGSVAADYATTYDRLMVIDQDGILVHKGKIVAANDINNAVEAIDLSLTVTGLVTVSGSPQLSVYPNPVADILHINAEGESISGIVLYDVTGKKVFDKLFTGQFEDSGLELSLQHLEQGLYFYTIRTEGTQVTGKLLIQR